MKKTLALLLVLFGSLTISQAQTYLPPFNYAYVAVTYSCAGGGNIVVFSQVFGACYQETNQSQIASSQLDSFKQIAAASCGAGVTFAGQRTSYPYQGTSAEDSANSDRERDVRATATYNKVEDAVLQTPYSSKCR